MRFKFNPRAIDPNTIGIVTLSHGPLAMAILETVSMLSMRNETNTAAFCLDDGDVLDDYRNAFVRAIKSFPAGCLVFVDIFGGSPSNQLLLASQLDPEIARVCAISSMNVSMILSAVLLREGMTPEALMEQVLKENEHIVLNISEKIRALSLACCEDDGEGSK